MILQDKNFEIETILNQVYLGMGAKAKEAGLDFEYLLDTSVEKELIGNPIGIKEVLRELIVNSLKFTNKGGIKICVTLKQSEDLTQWVRFAVVDSGIGIEKERLCEIITDIRQGTLNNIHEFNNQGYDLRKINLLVQKMGGKKFTIKSSSEVGSNISFELPLKIPVKPRAVDAFNEIKELTS